MGNITRLPEEKIEQIRRTLKGETLVSADDAFKIVRTLPHGAVAAVVGTMNKLGIPELLSTRKHPNRQRVLAMIAARILDRLQGRFGLKRVTMVGDRGMITNARIDEELRPRGVDWITALRAPTRPWTGST